MNWEKDSITFVVAFLILREIFSFLIWWLKKKNSEFDDLAFKITKEAKENWQSRYGHDFPFINYYFMVKRILRRKKFDNIYDHLSWIASESERLQDQMRQVVSENQSLKDQTNRLSAAKDNLAQASDELNALLKAESKDDFESFLRMPIWRIVRYKLFNRRDEEKWEKIMAQLPSKNTGK